MANKALLQIGGYKIGAMGLVVLLALAVFVGAPTLGIETGLPSFSIAGTGVDVSTEPSVPTTPIECDSTTSPTLDFAVFDSIKNGTSLSSSYGMNLYINGVFHSDSAVGTDITSANPGDNITIYYDDTAGAHDVYGFIEEYEVPCAENAIFNSFRGMNDGSLSTTVYQSNDITASTASAAEIIGAGATAEGRIRIKEATDDGYWSTTEGGQKFLLVADVNSNAFSDFEVTNTTPARSILEVPTPASHTTRDTTNNQLTISTEIGGEDLVDLGKIDVYFRAPALSGVNPNNDANILFTIMDKELYQNSNTGEWIIDYFDSTDNSDLGEPNVEDTYHIE